MNIFVRISLGLAVTSVAVMAGATETNLVSNGSFEQTLSNRGAPDFWSAAGNRSIQQTVTIDIGPDGSHCAKLECTRFKGDGGDYHAMICQSGRIEARKDKWYRLSFQAKAEGISGAVNVALINRSPWKDIGLNEVFIPSGRWERFQFLFQAQDDLSGFASRLQFWFKSTGSLWLDDVSLVESASGRQWFPQITTAGVKNFLPNASFECGPAGWGSITYGIKSWAGNLYRLEGQIENENSPHGDSCLKISSDFSPVFYFDYYEPIRQPIRRILVANKGWIVVSPGERFTLSAYLRSEPADTTVEFVINEAPDHIQSKRVAATSKWQRYEFSFTAGAPFIFVAVGPHFGASNPEPASVWIDALQLERGEKATAFEPREAVEAFIESRTNIFVEASPAVILRAFNNAAEPKTLSGHIQTADFFDQTVHETTVALSVPAGMGTNLSITPVDGGRKGFFRTTWSTSTTTQSVRTAVIAHNATTPHQSPLGVNHAYPWDFLVAAAHSAGVSTWRDWSAKWDTIESAQGRFNFDQIDPQIDRLLNQGGGVDLLLPFPSAAWAAQERKGEIAKISGDDKQRAAQLRLACLPKDLNDFSNYVAQVALHFEKQPAVSHFEILNEPLYTDYALPRTLGYSLEDYLRLLSAASSAVKKVNREVRIVGGIAGGPDTDLTREFIDRGGLKMVDVLNLHLYDPPLDPESFEEAFKILNEKMSQRRESKPVWITEWGCYADDDPACVPPIVGDATMNHCLWPSELAAAENLVKFAAISFAHGTRKIFLHAGVCGTLNGPDAGSVLFEYEGAPRKIYAAAAVLTRRLGTPDECVKIVKSNTLRAYLFRAGERFVAVAWSAKSKITDVVLAPEITGFDMMGNEMTNRHVKVGSSPIYLEAASARALVESIETRNSSR